MIYTTTVTQKGQVTIPVDIRRFLNVEPYEKVTFVKTKNQIILKSSTDFLSLKGTVKSNRKFTDKKADKKVKEFIARAYAKKTSRS